MSVLTREQVERECEWLVMEHCQSAARKWDAHDAEQQQTIEAQAQRIAELEAALERHQEEP